MGPSSTSRWPIVGWPPPALPVDACDGAGEGTALATSVPQAARGPYDGVSREPRDGRHASRPVPGGSSIRQHAAGDRAGGHRPRRDRGGRADRVLHHRPGHRALGELPGARRDPRDRRRVRPHDRRLGLPHPPGRPRGDARALHRGGRGAGPGVRPPVPHPAPVRRGGALGARARIARHRRLGTADPHGRHHRGHHRAARGPGGAGGVRGPVRGDLRGNRRGDPDRRARDAPVPVGQPGRVRPAGLHPRRAAGDAARGPPSPGGAAADPRAVRVGRQRADRRGARDPLPAQGRDRDPRGHPILQHAGGRPALQRRLLHRRHRAPRAPSTPAAQRAQPRRGAADRPHRQLGVGSRDGCRAAVGGAAPDPGRGAGRDPRRRVGLPGLRAPGRPGPHAGGRAGRAAGRRPTRARLPDRATGRRRADGARELRSPAGRRRRPDPDDRHDRGRHRAGGRGNGAEQARHRGPADVGCGGHHRPGGHHRVRQPGLRADVRLPAGGGDRAEPADPEERAAVGRLLPVAVGVPDARPGVEREVHQPAGGRQSLPGRGDDLADPGRAGRGGRLHRRAAGRHRPPGRAVQPRQRVPGARPGGRRPGQAAAEAERGGDRRGHLRRALGPARGGRRRDHQLPGPDACPGPRRGRADGLPAGRGPGAAAEPGRLPARAGRAGAVGRGVPSPRRGRRLRRGDGVARRAGQRVRADPQRGGAPGPGRRRDPGRGVRAAPGRPASGGR